MRIIERTNQRICGDNAGFLTWLFSAKRTAGNSDKTAGAPLLFLSAKPRKAQDFRQKCEAARCKFPAITAKNSEIRLAALATAWMRGSSQRLMRASTKRPDTITIT